MKTSRSLDLLLASLVLSSAAADLWFAEGEVSTSPCDSEASPCGEITGNILDALDDGTSIHISGTVVCQVSDTRNIPWDVSILGANPEQDILDLNENRFEWTQTQPSTITISGVTIRNGLATGGKTGGCLSVSAAPASGYGNVFIDDAVFSGCYANGPDSNGGALALVNLFNVWIENSLFEDNHVKLDDFYDKSVLYGRGAAIFASGEMTGKMTVRDTRFSRNEGSIGAGAQIESFHASSMGVEFTRCEFEGNVGSLGAILSIDIVPEVIVDDCSFHGNQQKWDDASAEGEISSGVIGLGTVTNPALLKGLQIWDNEVAASVVSSRADAPPVIDNCTAIWNNDVIGVNTTVIRATLLHEDNDDPFELLLDSESEGLIAPVKLLDGSVGAIMAPRNLDVGEIEVAQEASTIDCGPFGALVKNDTCQCLVDDTIGVYSVDAEDYGSCACPAEKWLEITAVECPAAGSELPSVVQSFTASCSPPDDDPEGDSNAWFVIGVVAGLAALVGVAFVVLGRGGAEVDGNKELLGKGKSRPDDTQSVASSRTTRTMKSVQSNQTDASEVQPRLQRDFDGTVSRVKKSKKARRG